MTDSFLDSMRHKADPFADEAVRSAYESGYTTDIYTMLRKIAMNYHLNIDDYPPALRDFLKATDSFAHTKEEEEIFDIASSVFYDHYYHCLVALFYKSLPKTYMASDPANVLRMTTLLSEATFRRIIETGVFIQRVMQYKWYTKEIGGAHDIQRIRLLHAGTRYMLLHRKADEEQWNPKWGHPISQLDMVATNQVFSLEILSVLEQCGIEISAERKEAYFYTWKRIGQGLGVCDELTPANLSEGWTLQNRIYDKLFTLPNESAPELTKSLVDLLSDLAPLDHKTNMNLMYWLINEDGKKDYPLESSLRIHASPDPLKFIYPVLREALNPHNMPLPQDVKPAEIINRLGDVVMEKLSSMQMPGKNVPFFIPEDIRQRYGIGKS